MMMNPTGAGRPAGADSPNPDTSQPEITAASLRRALDDAPMSRLQIAAVAICITLNMLDGFDVLVIAFTAADISAEWGLSGAQLGVLLSAGPFGMAGGSLFLAPFADRYGRRSIILICLGLITAGMLLSSIAQQMTQLAGLRVLTGIGIGGMLASIGVITSEYSSFKWRSTNVSLQATGYPVGATVGGVIAAVLIAQYGWRAAFMFGGLMSLAMFPVVLTHLPESVDFLLARRPARALERLNALLRRMGHSPIRQLPPAQPLGEASARIPALGLFQGTAARSTLLICSSFFLLMFAFYFIMSWTPKLLVAAGMSAQQGLTGGVLLNVGGIIGGSLFAWLSSRLELRRLTAMYLGLTALCSVLFGLLATTLTTAFMIALAIGIFLFGSMAGLYSLAPILYPAQVRTTGMGWAIGIGRFGAILAPTIAGLLVDAAWTTPALYIAFAVPLVIAVLCTRALRLA